MSIKNQKTGRTKMKIMTALAITLVALIPKVNAGEPYLWAINWGMMDLSYIIDPATSNMNAAAYPPGGLAETWDAAYVPSTSTLYLCGRLPDSHSCAIAVYHGGPEGLVLTSVSNSGLFEGDWFRGLGFIDGSLYGVTQSAWQEEPPPRHDFLIRIDNPGTSYQTATQIGPDLGSIIGYVNSLCSDGHGSLIGSFSQSPWGDGAQYLYKINISTGNVILLHSYPSDFFEYQLEGITMIGETLYGMTIDGKIYSINRNTYDATHLGDLGDFLWTGLVTVPEPSTVPMILFGIALFIRLKSR
jgi:hypothetical protein